MLNAEYWDKRYDNRETGWDIGYPSTPLKEYFDRLKDNTVSILIPGGGNSYEAEYLFMRGFKNVFILDYSQKALGNFSERVPGFPAGNLILQDFFDHTGQYDLIIEQTFFCAIDPALRQDYARKMHSLLRPGGRLVGLLFEDTLNTDKPPYGGTRSEYLGYFSPYFTFKTFERCYNSIPPRSGRELFIQLIKK
jgi:methyl halide transferase